MQALEIMFIMMIIWRKILLICDFDACDDGDNLCHSDEIDLILFLLDLQYFLLHANINKIYELPLIESFLLHR